jgi:hypothetical protein
MSEPEQPKDILPIRHFQADNKRDHLSQDPEFTTQDFYKIARLRELLRSGEWVLKSHLRKALKIMDPLLFDRYLNKIYAADSDSGRYACIPGPSTPNMAPDEF